MKVCYNTHALNPHKHPLLPAGYPWTEYHVEDDFTCPEGFQELPLADFETLKASFDLTDFNKSQIVVPEIVKPRQFRLALLNLGVTSQDIVNAINSTMVYPEREKALIEWEFCLQFERSNFLVNSIGVHLGYNAEQLDQLFIDASSL